MDLKTYEGREGVCFLLNAVWPPIEPDAIVDVINAVVRSLDSDYGKHVFVCVHKSHVEIHISNIYVAHIDTCRSACTAAFEALASEALKRKSYVSICHENCRRMVRMAAFESLDNTYLKLKKELDLMGLKYTAEFGNSFDNEKFPQDLKVVIWF